MKLGFKYDHFAYALVELLREGKFRRPKGVTEVKESLPFKSFIEKHENELKEALNRERRQG